jgi:hypothetical protein
MVTWNIRKTGGEKFEYDRKNRDLFIEVDSIESFADIIDGMHRAQSFIRTIEQDPNNQGYTMVSIFNYTEEEAEEYIDQEDNRTPMNKSRTFAFKNSNENNVKDNNLKLTQFEKQLKANQIKIKNLVNKLANDDAKTISKLL